MSLNITKEREDGDEKWELGVVVYLRLLAAMIIVLNGTVLLCLRRVKHDIPEIYTLQITFLCFVDLMAGFSTATSSFLDAAWFRSDVIRCSTALVFFISTQATTLYEVMAIGIYRFVILMRIDRMVHTFTKGRVILISVLAVLSSVLFCSLPYILFLPSQDNDRSLAECDSTFVFGEYARWAYTVYLLVFVLPLVATNILYGTPFVILNRQRKRRQPSIRAPTNQNTACSNDTSEPKPELGHDNKDDYSPIDLVPGKGTHVVEATSDPVVGSTTPRLDVPCAVPIVNTGEEYETSDGPIDQHTLGDSIPTIWTVSTEPTRHSRRIDTGRSRESLSASSYEARAFKLFGLVLFFLNIFTWAPLLVLFLSKGFSLGTIAAVFSTISCNSLVNPILHTVQVPEFRRAVAAMLSRVITRDRFQ